MTPDELARKLQQWRSRLGLVIGRDASDRDRVARVLVELDEAWIDAVRESVREAEAVAATERGREVDDRIEQLRAAIAELPPSTFEPPR
jgi:hypothetical protein